MSMPNSNTPSVDVSFAARQYVSAGWVLVPIAKGSKGPRHVGWNTAAQCIDDDQRAARLRGGIGLAHAFSLTTAIDIDDLIKSRIWLFDEYLIDIDKYINAPDAVHILSGRENRLKLLYRLPEGVDPLVTVQRGDVGIEFRCATRDGKTVQDVLPPTIHPDTLLPYQWGGAGDWHALPVLPAELLEVWQALAANLEPLRPGAGVPDGDPEADPVVKHLDAGGWTKKRLGDGTRHIKCPFEHTHTSANKVGDCSYFPAFSGGYAQGHFSCLHSHCKDRGDDEFLTGIAYDNHKVIAAGFEVVVASPGSGAGGSTGGAAGQVHHDDEEMRAVLQTLRRDPKSGQPEAVAVNLQRALDCPELCGMRIAHDEFRDEILCAPPGTEEWRPFKDADYFSVQLVLEGAHRFKPIGKVLLRDAVSHAAYVNRFDSAQKWLFGLTWDGNPRCEMFFIDYFGCDDTPYTRAAGRYLWSALASRIVSPGCQADNVVVLVGKQGLRKSSAVLAMAPAPEFAVEVDLADKEDNNSRKIRGALVAEFAELRGLRGRDRDHIKAFITRRFEDWTPKFKEFNCKYPRRTVFVGTTNDMEFLDDPTGNRRIIPLCVKRADVDGIVSNRNQLWAEACEIAITDGVAWQEIEKLAEPEHENHFVDDDWEKAVLDWVAEPEGFDTVARGETGFLMTDLLFGALGISVKDQTRGHQMRVSAILRRNGLVNRVRRHGGRSHKTWIYDKEETDTPF